MLKNPDVMIFDKMRTYFLPVTAVGSASLMMVCFSFGVNNNTLYAANLSAIKVLVTDIQFYRRW